MAKAKKGMGFEAAAQSAAKSAGVSKARGRAITRKASPAAKRANPNLLKVSGAKKPKRKGK